jgi:hypothetical protein
MMKNDQQSEEGLALKPNLDCVTQTGYLIRNYLPLNCELLTIYLRSALLRIRFLATLLRAVAFLATAFLAVAFFATAFLTATFLVAAFFAETVTTFIGVVVSSPAVAGFTGATTGSVGVNGVTGVTAFAPLVAASAIFSDTTAVAGITNDALMTDAMINFFIF